ncbi:MAG: alpha/beta fold hydrolase [Burkholderiales bacterium]|nr:alpha/beta fold hydrolase [Burkholderiales bacterium]
MKPSKSLFLNVRGLRYHVRSWGRSDAPKVFMLHGWMDVSASFQFTVDALEGNWQVLAPDWRGFGLSDWSKAGYWFPDYVADFDFLLSELSPDNAVPIVGHSMGGNVAALYAGVRPDRVSKLILAEGFGLPPTEPTQAPRRLLKWLDQISQPPKLRPYVSLQEVADRLLHNTPGLGRARAEFLAPHWSKEIGAGHFELRADPNHKTINPILYRYQEAIEIWKQIRVPVLWIHSAGDWVRKFLKENDQLLNAYRSSYAHLTECRIEGASHMMHHDQPEKFAAAIEDFLDCRAAQGSP